MSIDRSDIFFPLNTILGSPKLSTASSKGRMTFSFTREILVASSKELLQSLRVQDIWNQLSFCCLREGTCIRFSIISFAELILLSIGMAEEGERQVSSRFC
jgi:hypothetical protein